MVDPAAGSARDLLSEGLARLGYHPAPSQLNQLERHLAEIDLWNPRLKLVAAFGGDLVVRHVLDSLAGAAVAMERCGLLRAAGAGGPRIADLGSGAGFPGIPIAVMYPGARVDLVERSGRRAGFLRNAVAAAGLTNAVVRECDLSRYEAQVDLVVFRAFRPLEPGLIADLRRLLSPGGMVCAYKGQRARIDEELAGLCGRGPRPTGGPAGNPATEAAAAPQVVRIEIPFLEEERHLILFR